MAYFLVVAFSCWQRGILTREHTTFAIFRQSYVHLVEHRDLYALYPVEQGAASQDVFKYSPSAAVLFAPLSLGSYPVALFFWDLLNASLLFWAVVRALPRRQADIALLLLLPELFTTIQASSSNALIAALMLFAVDWIRRERYGHAAISIAVGASIKIFPIAIASLAVTRREWWRFACLLALAGVAMLVLPLWIVSFDELVRQYASWRAIETIDAGDIQFGMSLVRALREYWEISLPNWAFQLSGTILVLTPLLRRDRWREERFQMELGYSLLMFVVLFNHQAERQSFIIAAVGSVLWLVSRPFSWPYAVCYAVALTGVSVVPYAALWVALQADLLGDLPSRAWLRIGRGVAALRATQSTHACHHCRTDIPLNRWACPDCHVLTFGWLSFGSPQLIARLLVGVALYDAVTPHHFIFPWNLWDLLP